MDTFDKTHGAGIVQSIIQALTAVKKPPPAQQWTRYAALVRLRSTGPEMTLSDTVKLYQVDQVQPSIPASILDDYRSLLLTVHPDCKAKQMTHMPLAPEHLLWMLDWIASGVLDYGKARGWLGFIQGALVSGLYLDLETIMETTRGKLPNVVYLQEDSHAAG